MSAFVDFKDVVKRYRMGEVEITALDGVSFQVERGEFAIVVGPSGAGKSTILNILGGMDSCDEGRVVVDGVEVSAFTQRQLTTYRRNDIGFVFQFYNLVQNLTALENVELASEICPHPLEAASVLRGVGLDKADEQLPRSALRRARRPGSPSPGPWPKIPNSFCVMRPAPWMTGRGKQS